MGDGQHFDCLGRAADFFTGAPIKEQVGHPVPFPQRQGTGTVCARGQCRQIELDPRPGLSKCRQRYKTSPGSAGMQASIKEYEDADPTPRLSAPQIANLRSREMNSHAQG